VRREVDTTTIIGVAVALVAVIGVVAFFVFHKSAAPPPTAQEVHTLKDAMSQGKGGPGGPIKGTPIPPNSSSPNGFGVPGT